MFARESLNHGVALWLVVSAKCTLLYVVAWLLSATLARYRPAWRSFLWMAVLASFPCLLMLEWAAGGQLALLTAVRQVPAPILNLSLPIYGAVVIVLLGLVFHSFVRLHLLRSYSGPLDVSLESLDEPAPVAAPLPWLLLGTGLYTNRQLATPTSFGILRPAIILPEPPVGAVYRDFVRAALVHELIKTLRFDALWTLMARLVQCVWFPHPLVWRAFRHYCLAREQVCDRWTVRTTGEFGDYASHLVAAGRVARPTAPLSIDTPMICTGQRGLRARIRGLQHSERPESLQPWPTVAATVAWMLLLAGLASVALEPSQAAYAPVFHTRAMLMGAAGTLAAGALLVGLILVGRGRQARLAPPIDGLAGRSRQTVAECVQRLEREWRELQAAISGTYRRLEPLVLMLIVVAATVSFWLMAGPGESGSGSSTPGMEFEGWR